MIKLYKNWKLVKTYNSLDLKNREDFEPIAIGILKDLGFKTEEMKHTALVSNIYLNTCVKLDYILESY